MDSLITTPGMLITFVLVLIIEAISLLLLFLNIQIFRNQSRKYRTLLMNLRGEASWGNPGRVLLPLYILLVLGVTIITTVLFVFQPHLL